jgi:hypothetical protein
MLNVRRQEDTGGAAEREFDGHRLRHGGVCKAERHQPYRCPES